ncbi:MAG: DUF1206 domain-containing protein [Propionibacteriaceae bacterium]|nr:DUF1206 domain-containing protein [Propionibacteriaceae bacterium]
MPNAIDKVEDTAQNVEDHPVAGWFAAAGHVANGVVHIIIGLIAVGVGRGAGGSADQSGAMRALDSTPLGSVALWFVGLSLVGLGIYQLAEAIGHVRRDIKDAVRGFGRMVAYFAVAFIALTYATGGTSDGEETTKSLSATLLSSTWGTILMAIVALGILAVGIYMIVKGIRRTFLKDAKVGARSRKWFTALGVTGYVAKGLAVTAVGVLFAVAVWTSDGEQAGGLDSALKSFIDLPYGQPILIAIGIGLITYGIFCFARARKVKPS